MNAEVPTINSVVALNSALYTITKAYQPIVYSNKVGGEMQGIELMFVLYAMSYSPTRMTTLIYPTAKRPSFLRDHKPSQ